MMPPKEVLEQLGFALDKLTVTPFLSEEDGTPYAVWKLASEDACFVLKRAKEYEGAIYAGFFADPTVGVPRLFGTARHADKDYILTEYIEGNTLCKCTKKALTHALDALITLQECFWEAREMDKIGYPFESSLASRKRRGDRLQERDIKQAYQTFLERYQAMPRTLCHDDLLPFNILASDTNACLIDWEFGGILPYPTSIARLLAHGKEEPDDLFYLKASDRDFAIHYYYEHLIKSKGIPWEIYLQDIKYGFLYEYCEWIMLNTNAELYAYYCQKARELIQTL